MDGPVVGVPRALLYYKYHVLWCAFLEGVGCRTVVSPPTNRHIMQRGLELAVDESCLSTKVYLGHVDALRGSCDRMWVPRIASLHKHERVCVKFMGMYDIVRNVWPELELLTYQVDVASGLHERDQMVELGRRLCGSARRARRAYENGLTAQRAADSELVREQQSLLEIESSRPRILVVGHAYNLYDALIGKPILDFLSQQEVDVVLSDAVDHSCARRLATRLSTSVDWTYNKELLGSIEMLTGLIDGIVFVVAFPCGPDSLMAELAQRRVKGVPIVSLVLDEQSGEAGMRTRLESFIDILRMRRAS